MAAPPQAAPAQAPSDQTGGATTESMDVDEGNEEVLEVEVEAVWEDDDEEELDPRTLGVPGLRTLVPGDRIEVLWANGAFFLPLSCSPTRTRPQAPGLHHVRAGWERGRVKECVLEMRARRPVIIYRITYHDGEEVTAAFTATQHGPERSHNSRATATRRNRWQRTCARSRHGEFARWRPRRTCSASSSAGAC